MSIFKNVTLVAIVAAASLAVSGAARADMCQINGNWAGWGQHGTGSFDISSGQSCLIGVSTFGYLQDTKILKRPQHGTVKQLSLSSFEYKAKPGYTGTDTFVLSGTGHDPSAPAGQRSDVTLNVNVR